MTLLLVLKQLIWPLVAALAYGIFREHQAAKRDEKSSKLDQEYGSLSDKLKSDKEKVAQDEKDRLAANSAVRDLVDESKHSDR